MDLFSVAFLSAFVAGFLAASMPLLVASLGETIGEQSGVLNLGIEGVMLIGGYAGFVVTLATGSFPLGIVAGAFAGVLGQLFILVLSVFLGLNQIVIGLAVTLLGGGVTSVLYFEEFSKSTPRLGKDEPFVLPFLSDIPVVGDSVFSQPLIFWVMIALAAGVAWFLLKTNFGLQVRAAGQNPNSLDASGGNVVRTRAIAVLVGGFFAGLGGSYLALISTGSFTPFMTQGVGYTAIVVTMLARGRIMWVVGTSMIFGLSVAVGTVIQLTDINLPTDVIKMFPFVVIITVLVIFARSAYVPPALGLPYTRGSR
jgi:general nucleoside transport system permease protein